MMTRVGSWFSSPSSNTPWNDLWRGWLGSRRRAARKDSMARGALDLLAPPQGRREMRGRTAISLHPDAQGLEMRGLSGRMWVTQEGDSRDHLLVPGKAFRTLSRGLVVVWAVTDSAMTVEPLVGPGGFMARH